jgi:hypothetical protein
MGISRLHVEDISAATKPWNQIPLPLSPGAPILLGSDMTTILSKFEIIAAFTGTGPSSRMVVIMLPYYCTETISERIMMLSSYERRDGAALKKKILDQFLFTDCQPNSVVYRHQYLEHACTLFGGPDDIEKLEAVLHTYDNISAVGTERGMMVEFQQTEMWLCAISLQL